MTVKILQGDSKELLKNVPADCIDLVFTSPPYADVRKHSYDGMSDDKYVEWFLPISEQLLRVLKPTGSFVLNIKEHIHQYEKSPYVYQLVLALREQGWKWVDEYIWHKPNPLPGPGGKARKRVKDAWEHLYHFAKTTDYVLYQQNAMIPAKSDWGKVETVRDPNKAKKTKTGSRLDANVPNSLGSNMVYPTNVITLAKQSKSTGHSAAFPIALPEWIIKMMTLEGDVVLDPFLGSGTTALAAISLNRHCIGFELKEEYYEIAVEAVYAATE